MTTNIYVDENEQFFETPPKTNHSVTVQISQVLLVSKSLKYQDNNTAHRPGQKPPPSGKKYLIFQIYGESARS